MTMQQNN